MYPLCSNSQVSFRERLTFSILGGPLRGQALEDHGDAPKSTTAGLVLLDVELEHTTGQVGPRRARCAAGWSVWMRQERFSRRSGRHPAGIRRQLH